MSIQIKGCSVPCCNNNSKKNPEKLFFLVPKSREIRKQWYTLARIYYKEKSSTCYFCEDHFSLPDDVENYMQWRVMSKFTKVQNKPNRKIQLQSSRRKFRPDASIKHEKDLLRGSSSHTLETHKEDSHIKAEDTTILNNISYVQYIAESIIEQCRSEESAGQEHFLPYDIDSFENWIGESTEPRLKPNCLPSKFLLPHKKKPKSTRALRLKVKGENNGIRIEEQPNSENIRVKIEEQLNNENNADRKEHLNIKNNTVRKEKQSNSENNRVRKEKQVNSENNRVKIEEQRNRKTKKTGQKRSKTVAILDVGSEVPVGAPCMPDIKCEEIMTLQKEIMNSYDLPIPYHVVLKPPKVVPPHTEEKLEQSEHVEDVNEFIKIKKEVEIDDLPEDDLIEGKVFEIIGNGNVGTELVKKETEDLLGICDEEVNISNMTNSILDQGCESNFIKKEPETIDFDTNINVTKDLNTNINVIKEELVVKEEIIDHKNIVDIITIKTEVCDEDNELYENHIIKKDIVIGPEVFQNGETLNTVPNENGETPKCQIYSYCDKCRINFDCNKNHTCWFICDHCKKCFKQRQKLILHMQQHNHAGDHKCHICSKSFTFASNLARHLTMHSGAKAHKCGQCAMSFSRRDYLKFHVQKHHSNIKLPRIDRTSICGLCNKVFCSKNSRDTHMKFSCPMNECKAKRKTKVYTCNICSKSYPYRTSLQAHISRRHMKRIKIKHECDYCGKKYMKKHNLQCHIQSKHLNLKPYPCKFCEETFTWHSCLAQHERKAHGKEKKEVLLLSKEILESCLTK